MNTYSLHNLEYKSQHGTNTKLKNLGQTVYYSGVEI